MNIWLVRATQSVLHCTSGLSRQEADRIGYEIAVFLDEPSNLAEAMDIYGGDRLEAAEALTRAFVAEGGLDKLRRDQVV